jgi:hypothetical protein
MTRKKYLILDEQWIEPKKVNGIPQIPVDVIPPKDIKRDCILLRFYCIYCKDYHTHGGGKDPKHILYGNRTAHCVPPTTWKGMHKTQVRELSPFIKTGYDLIRK